MLSSEWTFLDWLLWLERRCCESLSLMQNSRMIAMTEVIRFVRLFSSSWELTYGRSIFVVGYPPFALIPVNCCLRGIPNSGRKVWEKFLSFLRLNLNQIQCSLIKNGGNKKTNTGIMLGDLVERGRPVWWIRAVASEMIWFLDDEHRSQNAMGTAQLMLASAQRLSTWNILSTYCTLSHLTHSKRSGQPSQHMFWIAVSWFLTNSLVNI